MKLIDNLIELYWSLGEYSIDDKRRMKAVMLELASEIRTWAPDPGQAKICHLASTEVADRIVRETQEVDSEAAN